MCTQVLRREIMSTPWEVVAKDDKLRDSPPAEIQREIDYVTYFLNNCNENKESIDTLVSMAVQDLLELDAGVFVKGFSGNSYATTPAGGLELQPMGNRDLVELWSRDGGSMLAETDVNGVKYRWWQYSYLHPAIAPLEFDINEVAYFMQYPRAYSVYGWSSLQSMDNILSSLINSAAWNSTFFAEATLPSGMIGVQNMNPEELERFRQYFRTEIKGRWHRIAVVNSDVKYVPFALTNRDMQWLDGQRWYAKIVMALFNITPTELGFTDDIRATGKAMGAQEEVGKRKSTLPILKLVEQVVNNQVVSELSQVVLFRYKPVDRTEELMQIDVDNKDLTLGKMTPNDIRRKRGLGTPYWWGDEPLDIIKARMVRGEPIPPLQLPKANEPASATQPPAIQRSFQPALRKGFDRRTEFDDDAFLRAFRGTSVAKAWPPVMNPLTGQGHTQDDSLPKEQYDAADENAKFQKQITTREISGNRVGWGKEQREDYLGRQSETIPGASDRGQLPTAIGRKPGETDERDGMLYPTDVGGEAGAHPVKSDRIQHDAKKPVPSAMGTKQEARIIPGTAANNSGRLGTDATEKPYDDTIDLRKQRQRPVTNPPANQITQGDPLEHYGQHPWEDDTLNQDVYEGHKVGVDEGQNPAYRKQIQPPRSDETGVTQFPTSRIQSPEYQQQFQKERAEHPDFSDEDIHKLVQDHMKDVRYDRNQGLPTQPQHQDYREHDDWDHNRLQEEPQLNPNNPPEESGDKGSLDEYQLDRLRQSPAGPAATLPKGYTPDSGTAWRMSESGLRERVEGEAVDDVDGTRKAKTPSATGFLREPFQEPDLSEHLPSHMMDQQARNQFLKDEQDLIPHPETPKPNSQKDLDLSGTLQDQLTRFAKFTKETGKEFGALIVRKAGQIILDQVQVGENHEINIEPTRPLAPDEEILGSYHQHPNTAEFSTWDVLSFLHSDWEKCMMLTGADGTVVVALKTAETSPLEAEPEEMRDKFKDTSNADLAKQFNFQLYKGNVDDLNELV